jgi:hypothetical protein
MALVLCDSCSRHLRSTEPTCPFCGAVSVTKLTEQAMPLGSTRAQIFLGALTLAAAASAGGCSKPEAALNDPTHGIVQPYGVPMPTNLPSGVPSQAMGEAYGAPPPPPPMDAGAPAAHDAGARKPPSPAGAYGAPPKPGL